VPCIHAIGCWSTPRPRAATCRQEPTARAYGCEFAGGRERDCRLAPTMLKSLLSNRTQPAWRPEVCNLGAVGEHADDDWMVMTRAKITPVSPFRIFVYALAFFRITEARGFVLGLTLCALHAMLIRRLA
jgi:hypothetical protein